ncbi:MAG TPA: hypothetical protein VGE52_14700, partial [Pirellulales bacterium]
MTWLFDALMDRLRRLFAADAAADFDAQFSARHAERRAELLRRANAYAAEGFEALAEELRGEAATLRPPALTPPNAANAAAIEPAEPAGAPPLALPPASPRKSGSTASRRRPIPRR